MIMLRVIWSLSKMDVFKISKQSLSWRWEVGGGRGVPDHPGLLGRSRWLVAMWVAVLGAGGTHLPHISVSF